MWENPCSGSSRDSGEESTMDKMVCDGWNQDLDHTPEATHKIGVGSQKWRVCEECYDAIIDDAAAGKVGIWDCN